MTSGKVAELVERHRCVDTQDWMQILTNHNGYQANGWDRVICPADTFLRFQASREGAPGAGLFAVENNDFSPGRFLESTSCPRLGSSASRVDQRIFALYYQSKLMPLIRFDIIEGR